mgnify:CR=1 FL=1
MRNIQPYYLFPDRSGHMRCIYIDKPVATDHERKYDKRPLVAHIKVGSFATEEAAREFLTAYRNASGIDAPEKEVLEKAWPKGEGV